jgi:CO dehydrogenase maturation factor
MRIAFLGKGGSGKTTTAAGFIRYASKNFSYVLAVDADVNAHLKSALHVRGLDGPTLEMGELRGEIIAYLKGGRKDLGGRDMVGTTPPSLDSNFISISKDDPTIARFGKHSDCGKISLLTVGTYKEADVGGACYHAKLTGLQAVFHHLLDGQDDIVIADTTAGTDNVATSLSIAYDLNVFVIEPTRKSLQVYLDFLEVAPHLAEKTYVVANKIDSLEDELFVVKSVGRDCLLGLVPQSKHLKRFEQGEKEALSDFMQEQEGVFARVLETLKSRPRDWTSYLADLRRTHTKVCRDWLDEYYGARLDDDLDSDFTYEKAIERNALPLSPNAAGNFSFEPPLSVVTTIPSLIR